MKFFKLSTLASNNTLHEPIKLKSIQLFLRYYQEYYKEKFLDLTFLAIHDDKTIGYVLCCVLDGKVTFPDGGVAINFLGNSNEKLIKQYYTETLDYLYFLAKEHSCNCIIIKDCFLDGKLSVLGNQLFNRRFQSRLSFEMEIKYENFDLDSFHKSLRKSYKSYVNWGKKKLCTKIINKDDGCFEDFVKFKDLHLKVAGQKTRSNQSWYLQYEMIREGFGELILSWYNDTLVAGALFLDYGDIGIYSTGAYERDLFNFGLSHFLLYNGIFRTYERRNTTKFSLGYFDNTIIDPKWYNIQFFKKGFCESLKPIIFWSKEI